jgi:hypothetical protein
LAEASVPFVKDFFAFWWRAWGTVLVPLAEQLGIIGLLFSVVTVGVRYWEMWRKTKSHRQTISATTGYFRDRVKTPFKAFLLLFLAGLTVLGPFYLDRQISSENRSLQQSNEGLTKVNVRLLHPAEPYKISRDNPEFGNFMNGTMAFMFLSNPKYQIDAAQRCPIKVTAPRENMEIAEVIQAMAASAGCLPNPPQNRDLNPEVETEALKGSEQGAVLIHMARGDERRDGFVVGMGNIFTVERRYNLPPKNPSNLVWIQIGSNDVWRKTR